MRHRIVGEMMTPGVVSVGPDTPFEEIARLLADHEISSVPVIDEQDRPLGVVSEADLLRHEAARGLMASPAVCARPEWTVVEAARVMDQRHLERLLVVDEAGRLIGVVSRSDLLRVVCTAAGGSGLTVRPERLTAAGVKNLDA